MTCLNCAFFKINDLEDCADIDKSGVCMRYPSVFIAGIEDPMMACQDPAQWCQPVMFASDWCGEFKRCANGAPTDAPIAIKDIAY